MFTEEMLRKAVIDNYVPKHEHSYSDENGTVWYDIVGDKIIVTAIKIARKHNERIPKGRHGSLHPVAR